MCEGPSPCLLHWGPPHTLAVSTTVSFSMRFVFYSLCVTEEVPPTHQAWRAVAALHPRVRLSPSSQVLLLFLHALQQWLSESWAKDVQIPCTHLCTSTLILWAKREWLYKKKGKAKRRKTNAFFKGRKKARLQSIAVLQNASLMFNILKLFV